jgi:limonene-1,2-epoxide hydrolase
MNAAEIVDEFIACWNRMDVPAAFAMMAEDAVWDNVPLGPAHGKAAMMALMANFPPSQGTEFIVHHSAANGNVVLNERTDRFLVGGRWRELRVMGTFEINDEGKIQHWRDYFDAAQMTAAFA